MIGPFNFAHFQDEILITNDSGRYAFLSKEEFLIFTRGDQQLSAPLREELEEKGFSYSDSIESLIRRNKDAIRGSNGYLFTGTSLIILAITNSCNNRCLYCQANGIRTIKNMTVEVAEQALQKIRDIPSEHITIEFQGGEPLLNYPVIQYVVKRGQELLKDKKVHYTIVTNLGLITEQMAVFFKENNVSVSTSLDGPRELHNMNRPSAIKQGSYDETIHGLKILRSYGIIPGAIETTTAYSLPYAESIVDEYVLQGFHQIFIRPLTRLGAAARCWKRIGYDSKQFLEFYRKALNHIIEYNRKGIHLKEYHASLFLSKILYGQSANYMELRSPCGAGIGQIAITASGNVYTCDEGRMMAEMGDEAFCLGNVFDNNYEQWIQSQCCQAICSASLLDTLPGCCDCVYKPYCGVCPVINYAIHGNVTHVSSERCKIYKGIMGILFEIIKNKEKDIIDIFEEWGCQA